MRAERRTYCSGQWRVLCSGSLHDEHPAPMHPFTHLLCQLPQIAPPVPSLLPHCPGHCSAASTCSGLGDCILLFPSQGPCSSVCNAGTMEGNSGWGQLFTPLLPADTETWLPQWSHRVVPRRLQGELNHPTSPPPRMMGAGPRALCSPPPTWSSLGQP